MKTIIIYDTDKGFTEECAVFIKEKIEDADMFPLQSADIKIEDYDEIYIGTYIVKGVISKATQKFLKEQYTVLLDKKLKLFISALDKADYDHALQSSLHPEIFYRSSIVNCGGRVIYDELSMLEKRTVKKFLSTKEDMEEFYPDKLLNLIEK